jgi:ABC-2 type transport system permease protein
MIIPLPLFPEWAQPIVQALPFAGLVDLPFRVYTGHIPAAAALSVLRHQVLWTIALVLLGRWLFRTRFVEWSCREAEMNAIRLYARYISVSLRGQMEYPASFLMQVTGQLLLTGIEFLGIWALFTRFGQIRGWTLGEVALFYGLISITWSIADALSRGFDVFGATVKNGDFDRILLRPRSTILQLFGHELTLRRIGRFALGLAVLIFASQTLDLVWSGPRIALLVLALSGGVCVFIGLMILEATSAFWTTESLEVWNAFTYGGVTMSHYPLDIYRPWFRRFFLFVIPLGCVSYLPGVAILGRPDPLGTASALQWMAPLVGPIFLLACVRAWRFGVKHYQSTGS